ncbi:MAG: chorismate mutase [Elusimicrobia bacterium]|nr:chorismate mutase [Elusimicrobiota bacterium]
MTASISGIRRKVDALDRRIADLLVARLRLLEALVPLKLRPRDRRREQEVLSRVSSRARGLHGSDARFLRAVYREIIRQCLARQKSGRARLRRLLSRAR